MGIRRHGVAVGVAAALAVSGALVAAPSQAAKAPAKSTISKAAGTTSLAAVLTKGGVKFDKNWHDYDILTAAVLAVLAAKPTSPVSLLTKGNVRLTVFAPTDRAFQRLVRAKTGKTLHSEKAVFGVVASLGIPTVEAVLLYHVIPGVTINARAALKANGALLTTAQGGKLRVWVRHMSIYLVDKDPKSRRARVVQPDINKGNKQIAHGINQVLLPIKFL